MVITATYQLATWTLNVSSTPVTGVPITVDGTGYTTNTPAITLPEGNHTIIAPATFTSGATLYAFTQWEDASTNTTRVVFLNANKSLVATYVLVNHNLTVNTSPVTGVPITIDGASYTSPATASLPQGTHSVTAPSQVTSGTDLYAFTGWSTGATSLTINVSLTADMTVTASYALVYHNLVVNSVPTGVSVTIDGTAYTTNTTVSLKDGTHTVVVPASFVQWA